METPAAPAGASERRLSVQVAAVGGVGAWVACALGLVVVYALRLPMWSEWRAISVAAASIIVGSCLAAIWRGPTGLRVATALGVAGSMVAVVLFGALTGRGDIWPLLVWGVIGALVGLLPLRSDVARENRLRSGSGPNL